MEDIFLQNELFAESNCRFNGGAFSLKSITLHMGSVGAKNMPLVSFK